MQRPRQAINFGHGYYITLAELLEELIQLWALPCPTPDLVGKDALRARDG